MPDLHALLAAEARRHQPESAPDFDALVVRADRRKSRRALEAVAAVVVVVLAVALGGWWLAPRSSTTVTAAPTTTTSLPVPAAVYAQLRSVALALAQQNGDPTPTRMEAVKVDPAVPDASRKPSASSPPLTTGYVVEVEGTFVCSYCKGPDLHGTVMSRQVGPDLTPGDQDFGSGPWQDLSRYGTPFSLAPATDAAPTGTVTTSGVALPVSPAVYARLRQLALQMASGDADTHPTRLEAVAVPDVQAADEAMSGDTNNERGGPGYVVEIQGSFLCGQCHSLSGGQPRRSTVGYAIFRAGTFSGESGGLNDRWYDLSKLGSAFSLATATTASPVPTLAPSQAIPPSAPPATESAGPTTPDPTSLAEAKQRAKASAINPAKAAITLAAQVSADELRVAGLDIPSGVAANTPMYVVVVNGEPIFPNSVDSNGVRATSFAVVFNTDDTGRGDQVLYRGAFNLPELDKPLVPRPTIVAFGQLTPASGLDVASADGQHSPMSLQTILAKQHNLTVERPRAELVYATTQHGAHQLAWLVEEDCVPLPGAGPGQGIFLDTSQTLYDATTGAQLDSATY